LILQIFPLSYKNESKKIGVKPDSESAIHFHEASTDIRIIQELLGHSSSKTTERYTHVSNRTIQRVQSPLDTMMKSKKCELLFVKIVVVRYGKKTPKPALRHL
jgi:hypothetical protein